MCQTLSRLPMTSKYKNGGGKLSGYYCNSFPLLLYCMTSPIDIFSNPSEGVRDLPEYSI